MSLAIYWPKIRLLASNTSRALKLFSANHNTTNYCLNVRQVRSLSDRRYSDKHEWLLLDSTEKIGTVGISKYAEEALGDVVYVQLPDVGNQFEQHDEVGAVESVKAASEIFTPVSGKITEVNDKLEDKPGLVNSSCYDEGWLFKIELSKKEELDQLMDDESYQKYLKSIREE